MDKITLCGHYGQLDILTSNQNAESSRFHFSASPFVRKPKPLRVRYAQALRATGSQSLFSHYESGYKYLNKIFINTDFGFVL